MGSRPVWPQPESHCPVDPPGQGEIPSGKPAGAVSGEDQPDIAVADIDVRMMVGLFRQVRNAGHERDGIGKTGEREVSCNGPALVGPIVERKEAVLNLLVIKECHDCLHPGVQGIERE